MSSKQKLFDFAVRTDVGLSRKENQDSYGIAQSEQASLFVVADGMGGAKGGAIASWSAVNIICRRAFDKKGNISKDSLATAIEEANTHVHSRASVDSDLKGMGCTIVAVAAIGSKIFLAHIGDSRIYFLSGGKLSLETKDHTLVQELLDKGAISPKKAEQHPAGHLLTRSLGPSAEVKADIVQFKRKQKLGDKFLLCCDGLHNCLGEREIERVLNESSADRNANELVFLSNCRGGSDNITAIVAEFSDGEGLGRETRPGCLNLYFSELQGESKVSTDFGIFRSLGEEVVSKLKDKVEIEDGVNVERLTSFFEVKKKSKKSVSKSKKAVSEKTKGELDRLTGSSIVSNKQKTELKNAIKNAIKESELSKTDEPLSSGKKFRHAASREAELEKLNAPSPDPAFFDAEINSTSVEKVRNFKSGLSRAVLPTLALLGLGFFVFTKKDSLAGFLENEAKVRQYKSLAAKQTSVQEKPEITKVKEGAPSKAKKPEVVEPEKTEDTEDIEPSSSLEAGSSKGDSSASKETPEAIETGSESSLEADTKLEEAKPSDESALKEKVPTDSKITEKLPPKIKANRPIALEPSSLPLNQLVASAKTADILPKNEKNIAIDWNDEKSNLSKLRSSKKKLTLQEQSKLNAFRRPTTSLERYELSIRKNRLRIQIANSKARLKSLRLKTAKLRAPEISKLDQSLEATIEQIEQIEVLLSEWRQSYRDFKSLEDGALELSAEEVSKKLQSAIGSEENFPAYKEYRIKSEDKEKALKLWRSSPEKNELASKSSAAETALNVAKSNLIKENRRLILNKLNQAKEQVIHYGILMEDLNSKRKILNKGIAYYQTAGGLTSAEKTKRLESETERQNKAQSELRAISRIFSDKEELELRKSRLLKKWGTRS